MTPRRTIAIVATATALSAVGGCSGEKGSTWATKAAERCAQWAETRPPVTPTSYTSQDTQRAMADLRALADDLAALDGADGDATKAMAGLQSFLQAAESGEPLDDIGWIDAFRTAGADACWQLFQAPPSTT